MAWDGMESVLFTVASMGCILDLRKDFIYGFLQKVHGLAFFWELYWLLILQKCPLWTEGLKVMVLLHRPFLLPPIPIFDRINSNQALCKTGKASYFRTSRWTAAAKLPQSLHFDSESEFNKGCKMFPPNTLAGDSVFQVPLTIFSLQCNYKGQITEFLHISPLHFS